MTSKIGSKIFALLIGIDQYQDSTVTTLRGCRNDCEDVNAWIHESFSTPTIEMLINEDATKVNILDRLEKLCKNPEIGRGDLVLIYFAGHGAEVRPLAEWNLPSQRNIQMRMPYDFVKTFNSTSTRIPFGGGILDRELSVLISKLSTARKTENIVVILDSCKSASGTRDDDFLVRGTQLPPDFAGITDVDQNDFSSEYGLFSARASSTPPANHVLLAACREDSIAYETPDHRGVFTLALLERLRKINAACMTYDELILSLDLSAKSPNTGAQYPHCDSIHKDRFVFTTETRANNFRLLQRASIAKGSPYLLRLGLAHDVKNKDLILLFDSMEISPNAFKGIATVSHSVDFQSELDPLQLTPSFALMGIPKPAIRIGIHDEGVKAKLSEVPWLRNLGVEIVGVRDDASLQFAFSDGKEKMELRFNNTQRPALTAISVEFTGQAPSGVVTPDPLASAMALLPPPEGTSPMPPSNTTAHSTELHKNHEGLLSMLVSVAKKLRPRPGRDMTPDAGYEHPATDEVIAAFLLPRLQQIGHFYYHLNDKADGESPNIEITFMRLSGSASEGYKEEGPVSSCKNGHIHIPAWQHPRFAPKYGFKVALNTDNGRGLALANKGVFFSLFYFSETRFRIDALYNPPTVTDGQATPCLLPGEHKTIGYGTAGDRAWQFVLGGNEMADIGYLKLFWSNSYLDLLRLKRPNISWKVEPRVEEAKKVENRRDLILDPDGDWEEDVDLLTTSKLQVQETPRSFLKTKKIPIYQFRDVPEGDCPFVV